MKLKRQSNQVINLICNTEQRRTISSKACEGLDLLSTKDPQEWIEIILIEDKNFEEKQIALVEALLRLSRTLNLEEDQDKTMPQEAA